MENSVEFVGAISVYKVEYKDSKYIRHEESGEGVFWWDYDNQGIWEYAIKDDELISHLEIEFELGIKKLDL